MDSKSRSLWFKFWRCFEHTLQAFSVQTLLLPLLWALKPQGEQGRQGQAAAQSLAHQAQQAEMWGKELTNPSV